MARSETLRLPAPATPYAERTSMFEAQAAGQPGVKRGLREGRTALDRARAAYLSAEWGGLDDRRPTAGLLRRVSL